ncbi:MAG: hypothetical protein JRI99_03250 [Deltaproteobacteria bacterium]|nr:hypothetical protein [Deltaproteobacteria bacterium]
MPKKNIESVECPICEMFSRAKGSGAIKHLKNAKREMLLAMKSFIEAGLENLDAEEKPVKKAKKVNVG